jgi:hypothetical protein
MTLKISRLALVGSSFLALSSVAALAANTKCVVANDCKPELVGKRLNDSSVETVPVGTNTETIAAPKANMPMFSISVDGEHVAGTKIPKDKQRKTDLALEAVDIQVKFDGLDVKPVLNVSTFPPRQTYQGGEQVDFLASSNYPGWIAKSEILIFRAGDEGRAKPLFIVPTSKQGTASWRMPLHSHVDLSYVLRVTDRDGRFDETHPLPLTRTTKTINPYQTNGEAVAPGYGEDRTSMRNIPVYGGAVTVFGRNVPNGHYVTALGERIPIDNDNAFVVQRILPPGDHSVNVAILPETKHGKGFEFSRAINIPENDWFYVGQADATVGYNFGSAQAEAALPGEFNKTYTKGRLAFYLKGKIKGQYLLTAAADTGEGKIENLFTGFDAKDPKQFLRRINPDDYYPVYGDDSSSIEDAPTRGKFFVRLAKGDSHVQWGNFKTEIRGTELLRNERALYGASGVYKSDTTTPFGERRTQGSLYAAQPGTLPQRDELRGTGSSAYFLSHQDVTIGSETISIETRDRVTGNVISRTSLVSGKDYEFEYVQGLIILKSPLNSTSSNGAVISQGALGNADNYLISAYEYTPALGHVDGFSYGGRAQQWLGDTVRVGVSGQIEKTGAADQNLYGADIQLRKSDRTYIEAEVARSQGPGFGYAASTDGGLTVSNTATAGAVNRTADALRLHGHIGVDEVFGGNLKGDLDGFYDHTQAGFSSLGKQVTSTETNIGVSEKVDLSQTSHADIALTHHESEDGRKDVIANAQVSVGLGKHLTLTPGVSYSDKQQSSGIDAGSRTDLGARLKYAFDENSFVYLFGQGTVERNGTRRDNNRIGVGIGTLLTEKVALTAEASDGTSGLGGSAKLDYKPTADDHYYLGYTLDPDRAYSGRYPYALSGADMGTFVVGANHAYDKRLSVFAENNSDFFGERRSLTQTYGVKYTPDELWTYGLGFEIGNIWDNTINATTLLKNSDFDRKAVTATLGFHDSENISAHAKLEYRNEVSQDHTRDMNSYLLQSGASVKTSDDWRLSANLSAVISDASDTTRSGKYVEGWLGYAYRPVSNDRLNALFKYTYLFDLPGADQVNSGGTTSGPSQISNILSADINYDLTPIFTIGGKYGFRIGETLDRTAGSTWQQSSAHLGVVRLDMHVVKNWDALVEARMLWTPHSQTSDFGILAAVYRQLGDNFKIGLGYNFGHFSDDLSHIGVDEQGVFINAIGKF